MIEKPTMYMVILGAAGLICLVDSGLELSRNGVGAEAFRSLALGVFFSGLASLRWQRSQRDVRRQPTD